MEATSLKCGFLMVYSCSGRAAVNCSALLCLCRCPLTLLEDLDALPRAHNIVRIATAQLNCKGLLSPQDIVQVRFVHPQVHVKGSNSKRDKDQTRVFAFFVTIEALHVLSHDGQFRTYHMSRDIT